MTKTSVKISGIAAAAAALIATGVSASGHAVDASTVISLADKTCGGHGCKGKEGEQKKKETEKKDFVGSL